MYRHLLALGITILGASPCLAAPSKEVVEQCMKASDFEGCVRVLTGDPSASNENKMTIDVDKVRLSGNSCPSGYAYVGGGACQQVKCYPQVPNDARIGGKGWICGTWSIWRYRKGMKLEGPVVQAVTDPRCPLVEPEIGRLNSCENGLTEAEVKSSRTYNPAL